MQQSELAHLEGIKAQDIQLMKFCQCLHKSDRLSDKIMDLEVKLLVSAQEIINKYAESQALKADLVESAPKAQGQMLMKLSWGEQSPQGDLLVNPPGRTKENPIPVPSSRAGSEPGGGGEGQRIEMSRRPIKPKQRARRALLTIQKILRMSS
jgi:hypothetical protein